MKYPKCGNLMIVDEFIDLGYIIIAHCPRCGYENHPEYTVTIGGKVKICESQN